MFQSAVLLLKGFPVHKEARSMQQEECRVDVSGDPRRFSCDERRALSISPKIESLSLSHSLAKLGFFATELTLSDLFIRTEI